MWAALKQGQPWMGIVKNRSKNGDHYWVNAYVTPIFEGSRIVGYESVRVKPSAEQIRRAQDLYQRLNRKQPAIPAGIAGNRPCWAGRRSWPRAWPVA